MIFKGERIRFDKENLPSYVFKFNVAMVAFFIGWFIFCAPPMIAMGCIFGESWEFYVTFVTMFAIFFIGLAILYFVALKLRERLVAECAAELEEKLADMPLERAAEILTERGIINENGFIASRGDLFGEKVVPFGQADFSVYCDGYYLYWEGRYLKKKTHPLVLNIYCDLHDGADVSGCASFELDGALFNFLDKRGLVKDLESNRDFYYLKADKKNLVRRAFGFRLK